MNRNLITERTISIYLQIAETARVSHDYALSNSMVQAAYEQVANCSPIIDATTIDLKMLTKLAEFLLLEKLTRHAEEIFNLALKNLRKSSDESWLRAKIYDGLSEVYVKHYEFEKARKKCEQAIRILAELPGFDPAVLSSRRRKLALINLQQGHNEKAHQLFKLAQTSSN